MKKNILFFLILTSSSAFAISTKLSDVINQGTQAIERVGAPKPDTENASEAHSISVTGTITYPDGGIAENFTVKAFSGKLGGSQLMGSALSDGGGAYTIAFPSSDSVTIVVKVYCKSAQVASSAPAYNITEGVSIDLTVPAKCAPGMSVKQKPGIKKTGN